MPDLTAYTLDRLMSQQAVIIRDVSVDDAYGGQTPPDWQPHLTVPCRMWWLKSSGIRSANREYATAASTAVVSAGGMILPAGTDVTQEDRISQVNALDAQTGEWGLLVSGIFEITAVLNEITHVELDVLRPKLGA